mgnify:CR=1 FL=1
MEYFDFQSLKPKLDYLEAAAALARENGYAVQEANAAYEALLAAIVQSTAAFTALYESAAQSPEEPDDYPSILALCGPAQPERPVSELQDRNLIDGYITMNGAYCFVGEEVIYKSAIPQEEVKAMAAFCEKKGVPCIFVEEHNISVCQPNEMVKKIFYDFLHVNVIPTVSFEEASNKEVIQMTPFITEEEEKEVLPSIPTCEIGRWYPAFADVTAKGDTKQKGIDEIIRHFGIKLEETMSFGDGGNDISMLRHAAIGVAMGQAKEDVKAAADYVTAPIDEDGISKAMKHFGII